MFPGQQGIISKFMKCESYHTCDVFLYLAVSCLGGLCLCLGITDSKRNALFNKRNEVKVAFVTKPLKHHSYICIGW